MRDEVQNLNALSLDLATHPQAILHHLCEMGYDIPGDIVAEWVGVSEVVGFDPLLQLHDLTLQCTSTLHFKLQIKRVLVHDHKFNVYQHLITSLGRTST